MRLKQLFESSPEDLLVDFLEDCRPYIERCMDVRGAGDPVFLYHGANSISSGLTEVPFRLRSAGKDTPRHIFNSLNRATYDMFGVEPRRWLFSSSNHTVANSYGEKAAIVFPTGNHFQWFKIRGVVDLYADMESDIDEEWNKWGAERYLDGDESKTARKRFEEDIAMQYLENRFKPGDFILNSKFDELFKNDDEVMLYGDTFYTATPDTLAAILFDAQDMTLTARQQKLVDWLVAEINGV